MRDMLLLTLFDELCPCWTEPMLIEENAEPNTIRELCAAGYLRREDDVYSLTEAGAEEYKRLALENFIEERPGKAPRDRVRSTKAARMMKLFDAAHMQRWGMKHYFARPKLEAFPKTAPGEEYKLDGDRLSWPYMSSSEETAMEAEFPATGEHSSPENRPQNAEHAKRWLAAHKKEMDVFEPDILYLSRYDYTHYEKFKPHPCDPMKIVNTDRFALVLDSGSLEDELETVSAFRRWIMLQRRVMMPGVFDLDMLQQDSVSWLLFVYDTKAQAEEHAKRLSGFGRQMTAGAEPFEIWTTSFEQLAGISEKKEVIWELIPEAAIPVCRTPEHEE